MQHFQSTQTYLPTLINLIGKSKAEHQISKWLTTNLNLINNPDFANRFSRFFDKFSATPNDYTHRIVQLTDKSECLAGIRFYGGDPTHPFVDVIAWNGDLDINTLKQTIKKEWAPFKPVSIRLLVTAETKDAAFILDQSIHAQLTSKMRKPNNRQIILEPVKELSEAITITKKGYDYIRQTNPTLFRELSPASLEELEACQKNGTLDFIISDGETVGLIATDLGNIAFIRGNVIVEELILPESNGHGFAALAQISLAHRLAEIDPDTIIVGTIHRNNLSSIKTAERAGRPCLFKYVFINL